MTKSDLKIIFGVAFLGLILPALALFALFSEIMRMWTWIKWGLGM